MNNQSTAIYMYVNSWIQCQQVSKKKYIFTGFVKSLQVYSFCSPSELKCIKRQHVRSQQQIKWTTFIETSDATIPFTMETQMLTAGSICVLPFIVKWHHWRVSSIYEMMIHILLCILQLCFHRKRNGNFDFTFLFHHFRPASD